MNPEELPVVVHSADSAVSNWRGASSRMRGKSRAAAHLGWQLAMRDIKSQYRQTLLGFLWLFLPVILTTLMFVLLNGAQLLNAGDTPIAYPLYAFLGSLFWQLFSDSLTTPLSVVTTARSLLARIQFPREALLVSAAIQVLASFLVKLVIALPLVLAFHGVPGWHALLLPIPVFVLMLLGFAVGQLLVPINLVFRDFQMGVTNLLSFLVFTVPVGYVPTEGTPLARLVDWNPITPLLETARNALTVGGPVPFAELGAVAALATLLFAIGLVLYLVFMPIVVERLSA